MRGSAKLLVDTGSDLNLIKINVVNNRIKINKNKIYNLIGIGQGMTQTIGEIEFTIKDKTVKFQLVPESFQVIQEGILGLEFLKSQSATISFSNSKGGELVLGDDIIPLESHTTIYLPPRTKQLITLPIRKTDLKTGYIKLIQAGPGVYLGNALVTPKNNTVKIFAINATPEQINLTLPPIELEDFEIISKQKNYLNKKKPFIDKDIAHARRICEIAKSLDLNTLNEEERTSLLSIFNQFPCQFHLSTDKLGHTDIVKHKIITTDEKSINVKQYRYPHIHKEEIQKQVSNLLENDIIEASSSPFNSPLWIVPKKADSQGKVKWRMVIDYRALNEKTISDAYPLPNITDILDQLGGAKYFSTLDLASGFHQIPMDPASKSKTAFSTPFGHYEYKRMPFGLKNAPATFQRLMDQILSGLQGIELFVYMDDIVIYSSSLEEHGEKLKKLLGRLQTAGLTLQPEKCHFLRKEIAYLGHVITQDGVKPDPRKIEAVKKFPRPKTRRNIKQFLGLIGYYRRFIPQFAKMAKPLTHLTKLGVKFSWGDLQQKAFETLRDIIISDPILQYPDFNKPFIITTDASDYALGVVLSQGTIGQDLPVAYASRTLNDAETRYSTTEKELLAILFGVEHFRPYIYGRKFSLVTDHRPLVWLHNMKNPGSKLNRWRLRLSEYDYTVTYKPGKVNSNADALSRNPVVENEVEKIEDIRETETKILDEEPKLNDLKEITGTDDESNLTSKDLEQILAIDGTVWVPDFDSEASFVDRSFHPNQILIRESFSLFTSNSEYENETAHKMDCDNDVSDSESDGYETAGEADFSLIAQGNVANHDMTYEGESGQQRICLLEGKNKNFSSYNGVLPILSVATPREEKLDQQDFIAGCQGPLNGGKVASYVMPPNPEWRCSFSEAQRYESLASGLPFRKGYSKRKFGDRNLNGVVDASYVMPPNPEVNRESTGDYFFPETAGVDYPDSSVRRKKFIFDKEGDSIPKVVFVSVLNVSCIQYKKDPLEARKDHLIHFISEDCKFTSAISKKLEEEGIVNFKALLSTRPQKGQAVVFESGERYIFHLVTRSTFDEKPYLRVLEECIQGLKEAMDTLNVKTCSMSKTGNGLDRLPWSGVEKAFRTIFGGSGCTINICTNEIRVTNHEDRNKIIEECHSSITGGHFGISKTYARLRERFYWEGAKEDVQEFIKTCENCQKTKLVRQKGKEPMRITDTPRKAFDKIQIDIVGPLPVTERGNKYILTIQDCLTKYSDAIPLQSIDSVTVAVALAENVICRFGCPRIIHTDQGSNFLSQIMKTFCKIFKIKQLKSTAFHPQSLGSLERSHHVFVEYLRHYCKHFSWDRWLKFAMMSFNSAVHSATQFTPHKLVFGEEMRIPSEFETGEVPITYNQYLDELLFKIYEAQSTARENIEKAKNKYKYYYDLKSNPQKYEIGEYVYLIKEPRISKLDDHYVGPYLVTNLFSNNNVEIEVKTGEKKIVHRNKLKLAHLRSETSP